MEREIGREMDTHIDADGARDVNDADNGDAGGEVISSRSHSSNAYLPPTHCADPNTTSSHSNTQTKARKPMLIPIPTDKGVELLQLPDYIPPRKDVWRELRAGDDEEERGGEKDGGDGGDGDDGERGEGGEGGDDEYAPLSIVKPYTPSSSHSTHPYNHINNNNNNNNNTNNNPSSYNPYNPYPSHPSHPSHSSSFANNTSANANASGGYPSFTLNLGVEESPLGALTPLTPLTPRTPGGRWFEPVLGQGQGQGQGQGEERDDEDEDDEDGGGGGVGVGNGDGNGNGNGNKGKGKQQEDYVGEDREYVDGDCGIWYALSPPSRPSHLPSLTPKRLFVFYVPRGVCSLGGNLLSFVIRSFVGVRWIIVIWCSLDYCDLDYCGLQFRRSGPPDAHAVLRARLLRRASACGGLVWRGVWGRFFFGAYMSPVAGFLPPLPLTKT
ncbi:hypothetical protein PTI98_010624 [Pleurotus ostreatus]|nr:hypothetical protein PTI98_010624 [Pleurotus ostreatus]